MKRILLISVLLPCALICSIAGSASAQNDPPPVAGTAPLVAPTTPASHGGGARLGVGAIAYLSGLNGLSFAYDPGPFHIDTMLGFSGGGGAAGDIHFGGRFWYHLLSASNSDLSVGAGADYQHVDPPGANNNSSRVHIEIGGLIRIFLVQNVAIGVGGGVVIGTADASGYSFGPNGLVGNASIHYFF